MTRLADNLAVDSRWCIVACLASLLLAGCQPGRDGPGAPLANLAGIPAGPANLISDSAGNLISDSAGNLIGQARGPAALLTGLGGLPGASGPSGKLRVLAYQEAPAKGALVVMTAPDETFYRYPDGRLAAERADAEGRYRFEAAPRQRPVVVSVLLGRQRRLVGYTVPAGETVVNVSLATTYVTELLRQEARLAGRTMAAYDLARLPAITALTGDALDAGRLGVVDVAAGRPDLTISRIPALVAEYLAVIGRDRALSDAWKGLLGHRPLGVSTEDFGYTTADQPGQSNVGIAADLRQEAPEILYGASLTSTIAELRRVDVSPDGSRRSRSLHRAPRLGPGAFSSPYGLALERDPAGAYTGRLWYSDAASSAKLWVYDPAGDTTATVSVADAVSGGLAPWSASSPTDLTFDDRGDLYVVDQANHRVLQLRPAGGEAYSAIRVAGSEAPGYAGDGGPASAARLSVPHGISWGGGRLLVADTGNHRIRAFRPAGDIETVAGASTAPLGTRLLLGGFAGDGGRAASALLDFPQKALHAVIDGREAVLIADGDNHRVRLVDLAGGTIRTLAGADPALAPPDDGAALGSALGQLTYLALDRHGDLLIAETKRVRRLSSRFGL
ncbi:MAG: hypothetical protein FJZ01_02195 [Candidatus Sericytochromatia bacterium]|nr:hypothetical protein [Candidatus Tanganyikabacteria bacterium]